MEISDRMQNQFNLGDRDRWNKLFESFNPELKTAPEQTFMQDALDFFEASGAKSILDIGCGMGIWSIYLARKGFDVYATDFSEGAITIAQSWAKEENLPIRFQVAPITSDTFPDVKFDAVLATLILDNVVRSEMDAAISIVKSKLKDSGALFCLFNPFLSPEQRDQILNATNNPTNGITSMSYSDDELRSAFPGFKFVNFKKYPVNGFELRGLLLKKA